MGSACLFFAVNPVSAVLADINADLVAAYRTVRRCPRALAAALAEIPASRRYYKAYRKACASSLDSFDAALRFIFLNRLCFNGVYRTNHAGEFNVPMGTRLGSMPDGDRLALCARALRAKTLLHADFEEALSYARRGDFAYLDPPYTPKRPRRGEYGYGTFGDHDIQRLVRAVRGADRRGVRILLSYSFNSELIGSLSDWNCYGLQARRHVAANTQFRAVETDVLISNYPVSSLRALE